jgi:nitronate monooxygenase
VLRSAIARLDGEPSRATGAFREKVLAENGTVARLRLLNRGPEWVVRRVEQLLPRVADDLLHAALVEMRDTHRRNIADCAALLEA